MVGTVVEILPPVWGDGLNPGYSNYRPIYTDYVVQVEQRLHAGQLRHGSDGGG
ncbi:hypothetical protein [Sphaerobacter thermophilus]|uniref:hypothetical protein n=1 Tax=Sphaerobacter thermophilus TaxID=2057 RepID=UPI0003183292|nr:hypothetical protein [Sphaerobacter thermophilus]